MTDNSSAFHSPSPEKLSELISGYEVESLVSSGMTGAIYEAHQLSLDRKVTIKVLPPEIGKDPALRSAFEGEAKTMARLNDPNLVDVFDFGDIDGMLFIIMEHVPGRSLHETAHGCHVDQKESTRLAADICHGLHHAHREGIVHRALEPKNILVNNEAQPKIVDFGLANLFASQSTGAINLYAAPETYQPGATVDHRADIYSAGMILYDLIVGHLPREPYATPSSVRNCHPEIDTIIYKAIQPDPKERYESADQMAEELEALLEKMGAPPTQKAIKTLVTASSTAAGRPLPRPVTIPTSSSSNSGVVVSLVVVAVLTGIIILIINSGSNTPKPKEDTITDQPKPKADPPVVKPPKPKPPKPRPVDPKPDIADKPPRPVDPDPPGDNDPDGKVVNTPDVDPTPEPEPPKPPDFDRIAWLEKARTFMRNKARTKLQDYDKDLLKNIDSFERDVKRVLRRMDRNERKPLEEEAEAAFVKLRNLGRLPEKPPEGSPHVLKKIYDDALNDQESIDAEFRNDFAELRLIYIQGIDKQISTLRKEGNDEHADALDEEIKITQDGMDRFMRILRDQDPDPEEEDEDEEKEKDDKKD